MTSPRLRAALAGALTAPLLVVPATASTAAAADPCAGSGSVQVPGAQLQRVECHADLSATALAAVGRSDASDWATLHSKQSTNPSADAGRSRIHRYYTIEDGNHVDGLADAQPTAVRPILPCYREAFLRLTAWVTTGAQPPVSRTVARPAVGDVANTCPELGAVRAGRGS